MTPKRNAILRLTVNVDLFSHTELTMIRAMLTRLNILHAATKDKSDLDKIMEGRKPRELYKPLGSKPVETTTPLTKLPQCDKCGFFGHTSENCKVTHGGLCQLCKAWGHVAKDCKVDPTTLPVAQSAAVANPSANGGPIHGTSRGRYDANYMSAKSTPNFRILKIFERKMPLNLDNVREKM